MNWKEEFKQQVKDRKFRTDSDLEDFADEHGLECGEVFDYLFILETIGTPCEGCKNIGFRYSMYPCNACSRAPGIKDRYESEL